jgi:hypothetical protein
LAARLNMGGETSHIGWEVKPHILSLVFLPS